MKFYYTCERILKLSGPVRLKFLVKEQAEVENSKFKIYKNENTNLKI